MRKRGDQSRGEGEESITLSILQYMTNMSSNINENFQKFSPAKHSALNLFLKTEFEFELIIVSIMAV